MFEQPDSQNHSLRQVSDNCPATRDYSFAGSCGGCRRSKGGVCDCAAGSTGLPGFWAIRKLALVLKNNEVNWFRDGYRSRTLSGTTPTSFPCGDSNYFSDADESLCTPSAKPAKKTHESGHWVF